MVRVWGIGGGGSLGKVRLGQDRTIFWLKYFNLFVNYILLNLNCSMLFPHPIYSVGGKTKQALFLKKKMFLKKISNFLQLSGTRTSDCRKTKNEKRKQWKIFLSLFIFHVFVISQSRLSFNFSMFRMIFKCFYRDFKLVKTIKVIILIGKFQKQF